jgi:hypothetical protein
MEDRPLKDAANVETFIRHSIVFGRGLATSLGDECYRHVGIQYLSIFYKTGTGIQSQIEKATEIVKYYTKKIVTGTPNVVFEVASVNKQPRDADGYSQLQVVCPFYFDTRRS